VAPFGRFIIAITSAFLFARSESASVLRLLGSGDLFIGFAPLLCAPLPFIPLLAALAFFCP